MVRLGHAGLAEGLTASLSVAPGKGISRIRQHFIENGSSLGIQKLRDQYLPSITTLYGVLTALNPLSVVIPLITVLFFGSTMSVLGPPPWGQTSN